MTTPKISIIIPVYNVSLYIKDSLLSALNQTYSNVEYILVNDCSTDDSLEIIRHILDTHNRSKMVTILNHEQNRGLSAARNTGMAYAKGEYIFFMDSDDTITPDCIGLHVQRLHTTKADFTIGGVKLIGKKSFHVKPISSDIESQSPLETYFHGLWLGSAWNKLYRAKFLYENHFSFEEGLIHEDILWIFRLIQKANQIGVVQEQTYIYNSHPGSITTEKNSKKRIESLMFILREMKGDWEKGYIPTKYSKDFWRYFDYSRFCTSLLLLNYDGSKYDAAQYYNQIRAQKGVFLNMYSFLMKLPFPIFANLLGPIYKLYKKRQSNT